MFQLIPLKRKKIRKCFAGCLELCQGRVTFAAKLFAMSSLRIKEESPRRCLECGRYVGYGRPDRKFCCRECKNRWHNRNRVNSWRAEQARILRILENNHRILERMLRMGFQSVDRVTLLQMGFHPEYVTSFQKLGRICQCGCYDILYESTPSRIFRLHSQSKYRMAGEEEEGADIPARVPAPMRPASSGDL